MAPAVGRWIAVAMAALTAWSARPGCCAAGDRPLPDGAAAAEKMFPAGRRYDFGAVAQGSRLLHRFAIVNVYARPVRIDYLQASCGCLSAAAGRRTLQPGEATTVDVRLDAGHFHGPTEQNVRVKIVGSDFVSTCKLVLTARSLDHIVCRPGEINFGPLQRGEPAVGAIDLDYSGGDSWRVEPLPVLPQGLLAVNVSELYRRAGQVGYRVEVLLKAAPAGPLVDNVYVKTSDPRAPLLPLLVEAVPCETPPPASRSHDGATAAR